MADEQTDAQRAGAAGWYPDPEVAHRARYWDGQQWTDLRSPKSLSPPPRETQRGSVKERLEEAAVQAGISKNPEAIERRAAKQRRMEERVRINRERNVASTAEGAERQRRAAEHPQYNNHWRGYLAASTIPLLGLSPWEGPPPEVPEWLRAVSSATSRAFTAAIRTDVAGITVYAGKGLEVLSLTWRTVVDIRVEDATSQTFETRIERPMQPLSFRTTPVAVPKQTTEVAAYLTIETTEATFVFKIDKRPKALEASVLTTKPLWGSAREAERPTPAADPLDQLKQLGELRDAGVLTVAEFEEKKSEILKRV